MRYFICGILLALAVTVNATGENCQDNDECGKNQCCVETSHWFFWRKGYCTPFVKEGKKCSIDPITSSGGKKYIKYCPCEPGLTCQGEKHEKFEKNLRCTKTSETVGPKIVTDAETTNTETTNAETTNTETTNAETTNTETTITKTTVEKTTVTEK